VKATGEGIRPQEIKKKDRNGNPIDSVVKGYKCTPGLNAHTNMCLYMNGSIILLILFQKKQQHRPTMDDGWALILGALLLNFYSAPVDIFLLVSLQFLF